MHLLMLQMVTLISTSHIIGNCNYKTLKQSIYRQVFFIVPGKTESVLLSTCLILRIALIVSKLKQGNPC